MLPSQNAAAEAAFTVRDHLMRTIAVHRLTHLAVLSLTGIARTVTTMGRSLVRSDETSPWSAEAAVGAVRERGGQ